MPPIRSQGKGADNVGFREIPTLKEQCFAADLGQRVGKTIAKVKASRMATLAKIRVRLPRKMRLFFRDRLNNKPRAAQEGIELAAATVIGLRFHHHGHFDKGCCGDFARFCVAYRLGEHGRIGLRKQNGKDRRTVDNHFGRPRSS